MSLLDSFLSIYSCCQEVVSLCVFFLLVFEPIRQTRLTIHVNNVCSDWLATMYFIVQRASAPADHELTCRIRARHQSLA